MTESRQRDLSGYSLSFCRFQSVHWSRNTMTCPAFYSALNQSVTKKTVSVISEFPPKITRSFAIKRCSHNSKFPAICYGTPVWPFQYKSMNSTFIWYKVVLTFMWLNENLWLDETLLCDHSNESYQAVFTSNTQFIILYKVVLTFNYLDDMKATLHPCGILAPAEPYLFSQA